MTSRLQLTERTVHSLCAESPMVVHVHCIYSCSSLVSQRNNLRTNRDAKPCAIARAHTCACVLVTNFFRAVEWLISSYRRYTMHSCRHSWLKLTENSQALNYSAIYGLLTARLLNFYIAAVLHSNGYRSPKPITGLINLKFSDKSVCGHGMGKNNGFTSSLTVFLRVLQNNGGHCINAASESHVMLTAKSRCTELSAVQRRIHAISLSNIIIHTIYTSHS